MRLKMTLAAAVLGTLACTQSTPVGSADAAVEAVAANAAASTADISGNWVWEHRTLFVIPTSVAAAVLPPSAQPHLSGPTTKVRCHVTGTMNLSQAGPDFAGTAAQTSSCQLREGPSFAWPFAYQPNFVVAEGRVEGRSIRFAVPPFCQNRGSIRVASGVATAWRVSGSCDIPIPDHPSLARTISWEATRPAG